MKCFVVLILVIFSLSGCRDNRTYQEYQDFEHRYWLTQVKPTFEFEIEDTSSPYNIYVDVRNSTVYPYARLFLNYHLQDSAGKDLKKDLTSQFLFDAKSGKPFGKSGLGDLYDHEFLLLKNQTFSQPGRYKMQFEQFMRTDTLHGIIAVGVKVEKARR